MPTGDVLSTLLGQSLNTDPNAYDADPARINADRSASVDAIVHGILTGQAPAQVQSPAGGPIGMLLQKLGLRSQYKPTSQRTQEQVQLGQKLYTGEEQKDKERLLEDLQTQGSIFGTGAAQDTARIMGAPELAGAFPPGLKGKGELAEDAQQIQMQKLLQSSDLKEQQLGLQQQALAVREAIMGGNMDRAMQLMNLRQENMNLQTDKYNMNPVNQTAQDLMGDLRSKENALTGALDRIQGDSLYDPDHPTTAETRINNELAQIKKQRKALLNMRGKAKSPGDFSQIYDDDEAAPPSTKPTDDDDSSPAPSVVRPTKGSGYKPLPAL